MIAKDIMTTNVRMIAPDADIRAAARLMVEAGVSALPVADAKGALVGIVSEGDLLRRVELRTTRRRSWWLELFSAPETLAEEYTKSHARRVRDVMTKPAITIAATATLAEIANLLERHGIKRVPVLDGAAVVGIVSRADLVKVLARQSAESPAETGDGAIRNTLLQRYRAQPWVPASGGIGIAVKQGEVTLSGLVNSEEQRAALAVMAETIPGVVNVRNDLRVLPNLPAGV